MLGKYTTPFVFIFLLASLTCVIFIYSRLDEITLTIFYKTTKNDNYDSIYIKDMNNNIYDDINNNSNNSNINNKSENKIKISKLYEIYHNFKCPYSLDKSFIKEREKYCDYNQTKTAPLFMEYLYEYIPPNYKLKNNINFNNFNYEIFINYIIN